MVKNVFKGFLILFIGLVIFTSCNKEQSVINDLKALSEEIAKNGENYTEEEWNKATQIHDEIIARKESCEFTVEQLTEINSLECEIAKNAAVAASKRVKNAAKDAIEKAGSVIEGVIEGLKEE